MRYRRGAKGISTGFSGSGRKGCGLSPTGGSFSDGQDVSVALRGSEWINEINMDVGKTEGRNRNRNGRWGTMGLSFEGLARETFFCPEVDVFVHSLPEKAESNEATGGANARMAQGMDVMKDLFVKGLRYEGLEVYSGGSGEKGWKDSVAGLFPGHDRKEERGIGELL